MKWIGDSLNRFTRRPWYEQHEIDLICQNIICEFFLEDASNLVFPISTSDLTVLVEQHTSDLDLSADLSSRGSGIEGVTDFISGSRPRVSIDDGLSISTAIWSDYRLRSTLMHELGHVILHSQLIDLVIVNNTITESRIFDGCSCNNESISNPRKSDWMEWQAYYAAGAFLMPIDHITSVAHKLLNEWRASTPPSIGSKAGTDIIKQVSRAFTVSPSSARVRLLQLDLLKSA